MSDDESYGMAAAEIVAVAPTATSTSDIGMKGLKLPV
jgi:hypothetical protein